MDDNADPVYSQQVIEFVAVANEFCKYAEHASEIEGAEMLRILQRILPFLYLKASLLPLQDPYFEDGNEKFVTEADWYRIHDSFRTRFGKANDYLEVFDEKINYSEGPLVASLAENMADIYQDIKNFLLLYQPGTSEIMNDAIWECRVNFETYWGQKLVNAMRAIHKFIYSGEDTEVPEDYNDGEDVRDTSQWFITRRQKDFRENGEQ